jgi:membrane protein YdbS with pleckstrin-like domain
MEGTFYGIILSALLAAESILLSLFGGLLGVYARYKTTNGYQTAPLVPMLRRISMYTCILLIAVSFGIRATLYRMDSSASGVDRVYLWLIAAISILMIVPAIWITKAMKSQ